MQLMNLGDLDYDGHAESLRHGFLVGKEEDLAEQNISAESRAKFETPSLKHECRYRSSQPVQAWAANSVLGSPAMRAWYMIRGSCMSQGQP